MIPGRSLGHSILIDEVSKILGNLWDVHSQFLDMNIATVILLPNSCWDDFFRRFFRTFVLWWHNLIAKLFAAVKTCYFPDFPSKFSPDLSSSAWEPIRLRFLRSRKRRRDINSVSIIKHNIPPQAKAREAQARAVAGFTDFSFMQRGSRYRQSFIL